VKKVFSIVVSYNGIAWIEKCLTSLSSGSYPTQIVVIDNGSADSTVSVIKDRFPQVHLIESKKNFGFGQANNIGIRKAIEQGADYVFLLNQDAWVEEDTIATLVKTQYDNPAFGILSPLHFNGKGDALDKNFLDYFNRAHLKEFTSSILLQHQERPSLIEADFVNAAAWMISTKCLEKTGGFDPIFFHYGEDRNYSNRALHNGFKIGIDTKTRIYHDREYRASAAGDDVQARIKRDWIEFLNHACDIRNNHYQLVMTRRAIRHFLLAGKNLIFFKRPQLQYNYEMGKKILTSFKSIGRSRQIASSGKTLPHL
jgi:GT2 family glycosyltransferase